MYYDKYTKEVVELVSIETIHEIPCAIFILNEVECLLPKDTFDRMYQKLQFSVGNNITDCDEVFTVTSIIDGGYVLNGEFTISFSNEDNYILVPPYEEIREAVKDELHNFLKSMMMQFPYKG